MKPPPALLVLLALASLSGARAGTIVGSITAQGKEQNESEGGGGKYDSRKFRFVERVDYSALRDFVIYLDEPAPTNGPARLAPVTREVTTKRVLQKGAAFFPHVLPVVVGTTVEWPNSDEIFHNVFSMSEPKQFDLGLYKTPPDLKRVTFDKPGRVDVFCSIHKAMNCIVLVLENPHFTVADERGRYTLTNVPAGNHRFKVWHERLPSQTKEVTVAETGEARLDWTLGISNLPKY